MRSPPAMDVEWTWAKTGTNDSMFWSAIRYNQGSLHSRPGLKPAALETVLWSRDPQP